MTITLTSKEFDEAVSLWLEDQGFSPDSYNITTRVIAGRSDGPLGTRLEVTLDAKPKKVYTDEELAAMPFGKLGLFAPLPKTTGTPAKKYEYVPILAEDTDSPPVYGDPVTRSSFSQRASQGHADE